MKSMSKISRDVIFSEKKVPAGRSTTSPRAWFHYLPLTIPLFVAICRYLLLSAAICRYLALFAANHSTICRYLPLAIPLFAANFDKLPLFAANNVNRKLPIRVI